MSEKKGTKIPEKGSESSKPSGRPEVPVVVAQSGFPISSSRRRRRDDVQNHRISEERQQQQQAPKRKAWVLDLHQAKRDVRNFGATGLEGDQKRSFEEEQYKMLTGRAKKKPFCPPNIARNSRKKAEQRQQKELQQAKEAGLVLPSVQHISTHQERNKKRRQQDYHRDRMSYGPAPSTGGVFKNGVLKLTKKPF